MKTLLYAAGASLPLLAGALVGVRWRPPRHLVATALAYAAGALIASVAFELFQNSYAAGGGLRAGLAFGAGALVFVVADEVLDRKTAGKPTGWALLAAVTLDGIPENTALGVSLTEAGSLALLVAVFASNFPEALAGAISMQDQGRSRKSIVALWAGATVLLAAAVFLGRLSFSGASPEALAVPLAFAGGAVLASVIDTLAPEAFNQGGPLIALASAAGFVTGFMLSE
ncbi:MAG: ZIP family metal transporter [Geodermatophilaceae bacterium]